MIIVTDALGFRVEDLHQHVHVWPDAERVQHERRHLPQLQPDVGGGRAVVAVVSAARRACGEAPSAGGRVGPGRSGLSGHHPAHRAGG